MLVLSNIRQKMEQTNEKKILKNLNVSTQKISTTSTKKNSTSSTKKISTSSAESAKKTATSKSTIMNKKAATSKEAVSAKKNTSKKSTNTEIPISTTINESVVDKSLELQNILSINDNATPFEYYDLPYRYNQTIVKILAQTPHSLFIYWDVSDDDKQTMQKKYGNNFFYETKPVLLVHNKTHNYSFEVEVDDFTNSWYLRTPTSDCIFEIELCRKKINPGDANINFGTADNLLHISVSNVIQSPNDHILNNFPRNIFFKNVKTNELEERKVDNLDNLKNMYTNMELEDAFIHNPSSNFKI